MHLAARILRLPLAAAVVAAALAAPFSSAALAADGTSLDIAPLHVDLPPGFKFDMTQQPITGTGPNDERVLVTVMKRPPAAPSDPAQLSADEAAKQFADGPMAGIATRGGKSVVRPVARFPAPEGKAAYSAASEVSLGMFSGKSHFVQYLFANADTVIYFTFEGPGPADATAKQLDGFFQSQRWDN